MNYKGFHQLQWEDRLVIEKMLKVGDSKAKIAEALGWQTAATLLRSYMSAC